MTSLATKRKHVEREVLNNFQLPDADKGQTVVKVLASRGNNLHEVAAPSGESYLASMPTKFRRHVWIKRGDFVLVEPIEEGVRVKAEIVAVLLKDQIEHLLRHDAWPAEFLADIGSRQGLARLAADPAGADAAGGIPKDLLPPSDSEGDDVSDEADAGD